MKEMRRLLSFLLVLVMVVGFVPANAFAAEVTADFTGSSNTHYLMFATDRHSNTSVIGNVIANINSQLKGDYLEYLGLGGDMVNGTSKYNSSTVLTEAKNASANLNATNVDLVYASSHDEKCTDDAGIMHKSSGLMYTGTEYYVYGITQDEMGYNDASLAVQPAQDFVDWVNGLAADDDRVIIVLSHLPIHSQRGDNLGAGYWHNALNTAATGSATGTTVVRDVVFFHGHNHTTEQNKEYIIQIGEGIDVESYVSPSNTAVASVLETRIFDEETAEYNVASSSGSYTNYYTYATAGYLNANQNATLVTITDSTLTLTKYGTSGSGTAMASVERKVATTATPTNLVVTGTDAYTVGDTYVAPTVSVKYSDGTSATLTESQYTVDGTVDTKTAGTYTLTYSCTLNGYAAEAKFTVTVEEAETEATTEATEAPKTVRYILAEGTTAYTVGDDLTFQVYVAYTDGTHEYLTQDDCQLTMSCTAHGSACADEETAMDTVACDGGEYHNVTVTYGGKSDEYQFTVGAAEALTGEAEGVTVYVSSGVVATISAVASANTNVAAAMSAQGTENYVAYDITPEIAMKDGNYATISLPVGSDWDTDSLAAYYVSDDGTTVEKIEGTYADGFYSFRTSHFSTYVVSYKLSEGTDVETGGGTAEVPNSSITEEKTVYVKVDSISAAGDYLIVDSAAATTSANMLTAASSGVTNTSGVTVVSGTKADGTAILYIESPAAAAIWTATSNGSGYTLRNTSSTNRYLRYDNGLTTSGSNSTTWYSGTNTIYRIGNNNNRYIRYNSGWTTSTSTQTVYIYQKQTISITTGTVGGEYSVVGTDHEVPAVADNTVSLTSKLYWTPNGGTISEITDTTGFTITYEVVSDESGILSETGTLSGTSVTLNGKTGYAVLKVTYTSGDLTAYDEFIIEAVTPVYDMSLSAAASEVKVGGGVTVTPAFTLNGETYSVDPSAITWTSSDKSIAEVEYATSGTTTATVTGVKNGTVTITATWEDPNGITHTESVTLTVVDAVYTVDILEGADGTSVTKVIPLKSVTSSTTLVLDTTVTKDGTTVNVTNVKFVTAAERAAEGFTYASNTLYWTVNDDTIVSGITFTYDSNGYLTSATVAFTGTNHGAVNISAIYNGKYDTITVTTSSNNYYTPADGSEQFPDYPKPGSVNINKTATAVGNFSETGIAQIELYGNGIPVSSGGPIDVVLVLDASGSMTQTRIAASIAAAKEFAKQICYDNGVANQNRIAVVYFGTKVHYPVSYSDLGNSTTYGYTLATASGTWEESTLYSCINGYCGNTSTGALSGGTKYDDVLAVAERILDNARSDGTGDKRNQYLVFMTDGAPTEYAYASNYEAVQAGSATEYTKETVTGADKDGASATTAAQYEYYTACMKQDKVTVYTVGTALSATDDANSVEFLRKMATDDSKAYAVSQADVTSGKLANVFSTIASEIKAAASNVTVYDTITPEYELIFELPKVHSNGDNDPNLSNQEFYIEVVNYALDSSYNRTGTATNVMRVYLAQDTSGNVYITKTIVGETTTEYTQDSQPTATFTAKGADDPSAYFNWKDADNDGVVEVSEVTYVSDGTGTYNLTAGAFVTGNNTSGTMLLATPYFIYDQSKKSFTWTTDELGDKNQIALRYFVYLTGSVECVENKLQPGDPGYVEPKAYETNTVAWIAYTNHNDKLCYQYFPEPQLTWNGAQVTYVFYLVNDDGLPVNKAGQVINFTNAVEVTQRYTQSVVWNDSEGTTSLDVTTIAAQVLPEFYTLYDPKAAYEIHVYQDEAGSDVGTNYFIITNTVPINGDDDGVNTDTDYTTKVFMDKSSTKYDLAGYYTKSGGVTTQDGKSISTAYSASGFDFADTTVAFAVLWTPELQSDTVVVDFGLDVVVDVTYNDFFANTINGIGITAHDATINKGVYAGTTGYEKGNITVGNCTISIESANEVRVHQNTMEFNAPVTFFYDSKVTPTQNGTTQEGYMYSSVTVIPATTVYYEDSFLTFAGSNGSGVLTEIPTAGMASGQWYMDGETIDKNQDADRPGDSKLSFELDADNVYGYDSAYTEMSEYSMGSAAMIHVDANSYGKASFTFYGTGFDVISQTSNMTGTLIVSVVDADGNPVKNQIVDTYYGYALSDTEYDKLTYTFWGYGYKTVDIDAFEDGVTYYTKDAVSYSEAHTYKEGETYWTLNDGEYVLADISEFAEGVTYYTKDADSYTAASEYVEGTTYYVEDTSDERWSVTTESVTKSDTEPCVSQDKPADRNIGKTTYTVYKQKWVVSVNNPNAVNQVPVMKISGLTYGQYTATITATYNSYFDHTPDAGYDLYLDAIRIYDPTGNLNDVANGAYGKDKEAYPQYVELRDNVINADTFTTKGSDKLVYYTYTEVSITAFAEGKVYYIKNADGTYAEATGEYNSNTTYYARVDGSVAGLVFIDSNDATSNISDYTNYGPNNELYLQQGQAIAFKLTVPNGAADVQVGMKLANGANANYEIYNVLSSGAKVKAISGTVKTATDMYYSIKEQADNGTIVIVNTGSGILSLTNIKITYGTAAAAAVANEISIDGESATNAVKSLSYVTPSTATFDPETMDINFNRTTAEVGNNVIVTVTTSDDVKDLLVNGSIATNKTTSYLTGETTWSFTVPVVENESLKVTVVGYDANGEYTVPYSESVTVVNMSGSAEDLLGQIFG